MFRFFLTLEFLSHNFLIPSYKFKAGLVLLIAFAIRFYTLGKQGLFYDEAFSWVTKTLPLPALFERTLNDGHVPLYYVLLKFFLHYFPTTEASLRLVSSLLSVFALAVILWFVPRIWGEGAALMAGWFLAFSSFDLYYAQEARMYTLLGLFWLLSYAFTVQAVKQNPRYFVALGVINVLIGWTHYYGLFTVGITTAFILGWYLLRVRRKQSVTTVKNWLFIGIAISFLGTVPVVLSIWQHRSFQHGGTWLPNLSDLIRLFGLISVGLTAARDYFLDSAHLVFAPFANISLIVWALIGFFSSGLFALWGFWKEWQKDEHRFALLLGVSLLVIPVAFVFLYSVIFGLRMWALRGFIGTAYLYYLWVGIGFSQIRNGLVQKIGLVLYPAIALLSILPYFGGWVKTDANLALRSLPEQDSGSIILLDRTYVAPVAFYYLGNIDHLWGLTTQADGTFRIAQISGYPVGTSIPIDCSAISGKAQRIWAYSTVPGRIRQEWQKWPSCITSLPIQIYENGQWILLNP